VSAGLDWVTLTTTAGDSKREMVRYFGSISVRDFQLGYPTVTGGAYGFYGHRCRHALLASKEERTMLQVSGYEAQRAIMLCRKGDNATRLDIQVTVRIEGCDVSEALTRIAGEARTCVSAQGIRPKVSEVHVDGKIETVYVGSRKSEVFIRCYDKYAESGEERYKGCVRLEVELKGKTSKALWQHCADNGLGTGYLLQVLKFYLERRGISAEWVPWEEGSVPPPPLMKTSFETRIGWYATQVAPSVKKMASEWGWQTPFQAIFGKALTEWDRSMIMNAISKVWGT